MKTETLYIKGMICSSCKHLIRFVLENEGFVIVDLKIGKLKVAIEEKVNPIENIKTLLLPYEFTITRSCEELLIDEIKRTVVDLIYHMNNMNSIVQKSEYLVEMLNMNYDKISREFRKHEAITLEKFIIRVKIERIKELIESENYTLSEIAYMMDYSSVQHLSTQFKKVTGITVSDYKHTDKGERVPLDCLCDSK